MNLKKAIFLAQDGVLFDAESETVDPTRLRLAPAAASALPLLHASGYRLFILAEYPGIALGHYTEDALVPLQARVRQLLTDLGVPLTGFYYCPHDADGSVDAYAYSCLCRKPAAGLLQRAAGVHKLDLGASWVIGDLLDDVEAAHNAGTHGVLIDNGRETEWRTDTHRRPEAIAVDLAEAAVIIASSARGGIRAS